MHSPKKLTLLIKNTKALVLFFKLLFFCLFLGNIVKNARHKKIALGLSTIDLLVKKLEHHFFSSKNAFSLEVGLTQDDLIYKPQTLAIYIFTSESFLLFLCTGVKTTKKSFIWYLSFN